MFKTFPHFFDLILWATCEGFNRNPFNFLALLLLFDSLELFFFEFELLLDESFHDLGKNELHSEKAANEDQSHKVELRDPVVVGVHPVVHKQGPTLHSDALVNCI
jgi:hypothetical protein